MLSKIKKVLLVCMLAAVTIILFLSISPLKNITPSETFLATGNSVNPDRLVVKVGTGMPNEPENQDSIPESSKSNNQVESILLAIQNVPNSTKSLITGIFGSGGSHESARNAQDDTSLNSEKPLDTVFRFDPETSAHLKLHTAVMPTNDITTMRTNASLASVITANISSEPAVRQITLAIAVNSTLLIRNINPVSIASALNHTIIASSAADIMESAAASPFVKAQLTTVESNITELPAFLNKSTAASPISPQFAGSRLYISRDKASYNSGEDITIYVEFYNDELMSQQGWYTVVLADLYKNPAEIVKWVYGPKLLGFSHVEDHFSYNTKYDISEGRFLWAYAVIQNDLNSNDVIDAVSARFGVGLTLSGRLVDENGNSLANKAVKLTSCSNSIIASTTTNSNGDFSLKTGNKGSYKVKVEMPYGTLIILPDGTNECYTYMAGVWSLGTITLDTTTSIEGTVVDENGNAVQNAIVKWTDCSNNDAVSSTTDAQGRYRLVADRGNYKLKVLYNGLAYTFTFGGVECAYFSSDYQATLDIRIRAHIYGKVQNELGANVNGATVKLITCAGTDVTSTTTNSLGEFSLRSYAGNYKLKVLYNNIQYDYNFGVDCPFFYPEDYNLGTMEIVAKVHITGRLVNEYSQGIAGATVKLTDCSDRLVASTAADNSGAYTLVVNPGNYKLKAVDGTGEFTFSVNGNECNSYNSGYATLNLEIPVDAHISGQVVDEDRAPFWNIPVKFQSCTSSTARTGYTNTAGLFTVDIPPGSYKALLDMPYADLTLLVNNNECNYYSRGYLSFSNPITAYRNFYLTGYFYDLYNNPLANVGLEAHYCTGGLKASASTGSSGRFSLSSDAGYYKLKLVIQGKRFKLQDSEGNECFLLLGPINAGVININPNPNCSQFNYYCYSDDTKLFGCYYDNYREGCVCSAERCMYGCTDGARQCDAGVQGTIKVDVDDLRGNPIYNMKIHLEGHFYGYTNAAGKADVLASYGYRDVSARCPNNDLCNTQTVYVDGTEYVYFDCNCVLDSDSDGFSDDDEHTIGTNPYSSTSNLFSALNSNKIAKTCFGMSPIFSAFLSSSEMDALITILNDSSLAEISEFGKGNTVPVLERSGIDLTNASAGTATLVRAVTHSSEVMELKKGSYYFLFIKDSETGVTSVFAVSANCAGTIIGLVDGVGTGIKDDVGFAGAIIQGIWHYATHANEIGGIWNEVTNLLGGIGTLFSEAGSIFKDVSMGIFAKGQEFNIFTGDEDDYLSFQIGFYQGYIVGYAGEQTVLLGKFVDAVKVLKIGAKAGQVVDKAAEILARLTTKFSGTVADTIRNLKVWEAAKFWSEGEIDGLARIAKNRQASWINQQAASYLKELSGKIDGLADDLTRKFGTVVCFSTCKSVEEIIDALAKYGLDHPNVIRIMREGSEDAKHGIALTIDALKNDQSRLKNILEKLGSNYENLNLYAEIVGKSSKPGSLWGAGQLDSLATSFNNIVARYGGEILSITGKGIENNVIDITKVNPEKLAKYINAVRKLDSTIGDPMEDIGKHQLMKMMKATGVSTKVGSEAIDGVSVLKRGSQAEGWGWEHITKQSHHNQIQEAFGLADNDRAVKELIGEAVEKGFKNPSDEFEIIYNVPGKQKSLRVILSSDAQSIGSITSAYPG